MSSVTVVAVLRSKGERSATRCQKALCSVFIVCRDENESRKVMIAMSVSMTAGLIMFIMSLFQLGFIVTYMSDSFISGYIAAANILVSLLSVYFEQHSLSLAVCDLLSSWSRTCRHHISSIILWQRSLLTGVWLLLI